MRTVVAAILTVALLVTSGAIALDLAVLMRTPLQVTAPDAAINIGGEYEPVIAAFYDAANALLAGESAALLATVISPDIEVHAGNGPAASGDRGMRDHLAGLRQRGAGALSVVRLIGASDEVAVVIDAYEVSPTDAELAAEPSPAPRWRTVDLFRMAAGMIVGYWPGALEGSATHALPTVTMPSSAQKMGVSLARLEIGPDAEPTPLFASVPHLLIVETGTLAVAQEHAFDIARAGSSRFVSVAADPGAGELLVGPGDALLIPGTLPVLVRNPGQSSASVLSLLAAPTSLLFQQIRAGPSADVTVEAMHDGWRVGRPIAWDNNVITEPLAVKHLPLNRSLADVALSSSQISLAPGQRRPPLPPGKLRLAIVSAGVVGVSVMNGNAVPIAAPNPDSERGIAADHLFWAGDAFWIEASEAPVLANAGVSSLDILLIEVALEGEVSSATPIP